MIASSALRLCACLLLAAAPSLAAGVEPVTLTPLPVPMDGYSDSAYMVNDRGEVVGGLYANGLWYGVSWSPLLEPLVLQPPADGYALFPDALNERGQIAGTITVDNAWGSPSFQLFRWSPVEGMLALGALPGGAGISISAMNNRGDIVGSGDDPWGPSAFGNSGFLWTRDGGYERLTLPPGGLEGFPTDINDNGLVVGEYARGTDEYDLSFHAALWRPDGSFLELGTPSEFYSAASFVNERGQVAGVFSMDHHGHKHPFVWSAEAGFVDCGQLVEGDFVDVTGFNDRGHMAGISYQGGAWFWSPETGTIPLGNLGGSFNSTIPHAMNNHDQVVGWSWAANPVSGRQERRAFLWSPSTGMQDLGTNGGQASEAYDISDRGRIAGMVATIDDSTGYMTQVPVIWTIPDLGSAFPDDEDQIARLIREVTELRAAGGLTHAGATELLQALEKALAFRDGENAHQASQALERFTAHVRQLVKRGSLDAATGDGWIVLAGEAIRLLGE